MIQFKRILTDVYKVFGTYLTSENLGKKLVQSSYIQPLFSFSFFSKMAFPFPKYHSFQEKEKQEKMWKMFSLVSSLLFFLKTR
jgi:hypothetical protein